ncbi:MAG: hypothetical protein UR28_C0030G0016 [Candidatus Peregrinibacteria bacterium GW2011_GWF2_33_10]|nr:MAG: hypothetical protein UR28_C0030G0016 [Candidatus Peregrinibacteria bacterium GW2011_GWF2_33_10]OGJ45140.1 MAG: hypothetical protein A2263_05305 [Candidatus Peregrinibacteria bacterium RIFOXYA2_FULL_33_21]OGJ46331.1 MAG: hypothetical protein A2272_04060 [Candidatus Peregrinibacteria bacterium RIFOXYA12_FULL_33_12]OGJ50809.1 MAG: hypothetical protein A2307_02075 [Candidatus Peregrinibacteria bacterium RIFOXYB2_FULL_33_20]
MAHKKALYVSVTLTIAIAVIASLVINSNVDDFQGSLKNTVAPMIQNARFNYQGNNSGSATDDSKKINFASDSTLNKYDSTAQRITANFSYTFNDAFVTANPSAQIKINAKINDASSGSLTTELAQTTVTLDTSTNSGTYSNGLYTVTKYLSISLPSNISLAVNTAYQAVITLDPDNNYVETSETDNSSTVSFTYNIAPSQYPDIIAKNINVNKVPLADGTTPEHITYDICVDNYNDVASQVYNGKQITVELKVNSQLANNQYTLGTDLAQNKCKHFDGIVNSMNPGDTIQVDLKVDSTNQVTESNENNNQTSQSFVY